METYEQAVEYLYSRINYERVHVESYSARDFKLDRMQQLLDRLGNPHAGLPAVHIAGTKGKGSTAAMVAAIAQAAGLRVGLFTSPHISAFEERMQVDGQPPSPEKLVELVRGVLDPVAAMDKAPGRMSPTYFEIATAMAWRYFAEQRVDLVVLEVGLGGRLDATNLCRPEVSVITSISRDHTALLGNTLAEIAREKAGIIKPGVPVVSGVRAEEARAVVEQTSRDHGCRLIQLDHDLHYTLAADNAASRVTVRTPWREWSDLRVPLVGAHQGANAALAVGVADVLRDRGWAISPEAVPAGLAAVRWPARIEVLRTRPTVIVDAAHNWASVGALLDTLRAGFSARRRILVFSATRDKDVAGLLRRLVGAFDTLILTQYQSNPRVVPVAELHRLLTTLSDAPAHVTPDPSAAWKLARRLAGPDDLVCITGSFFIAAELRELILDTATDDHPATQISGAI